MPSLCIVGAGVAGAGAAYALRDTAIDVTVLEKSRGVGGRAATRRRNGACYDHGANYVKDDDPRTAALLRDLGEAGLVDLDRPVWTFDETGDVEPGRDDEAHKWTWEAGITQLAKRLFGETDAEVRLETRVTGGERGPKGWRLADTDGATHGPFDALLVTPPAPQSADLLYALDGSEAAEDLADAASEVPYRTIRTFVFHYDRVLDVPWYALVDTSESQRDSKASGGTASTTGHEVGWLAREECKEGHVPDGEGLLVAQMSPAWSERHYDDPLDEAAEVVADLLVDLVDEPWLTDFDWCDDQRWRYALPDAGIDEGIARAGEGEGLFVAGDWVAGEGRVHAALWNGQAVADRVAASLDGTAR